jgi:primosomal protein N' (replication factor Y) (superfamily II helicase)
VFSINLPLWRQSPSESIKLLDMENPQFVRVAVNVPTVNGEFDYSIPIDLAGKIQPGSLVEVPFNNRPVHGVVTRLIEIPEVLEVKPITSLVDSEPVVTPQLLQLAAWMASETLSTPGSSLDLMLPPGLSSHADTYYEIIPGSQNPENPTLSESRILQTLQKRGGLRRRQLEAANPHIELNGMLRKLVRSGWISSKPVLPPPRVRPKFVRTAALASSPERLEDKRISLSRTPSARLRRQRALDYLAGESVPVDVTWVYAASGCTLADLIALQEMDLVVLSETEVWRDPLQNIQLQELAKPVLTGDQQKAWEVLSSAINQINDGKTSLPHLLEGITSSGKTELYLRAVEAVLAAGRSAIIMVPEISLTPLAVQRFLARFPGMVGLVHSKLTPGERYDTWRRARAGLLSIIIGPRSALFTPLQNIGLIVADECHDDSYYQSDPSPSYSALRVAEAYCRITGSLFLAGSATPDITQLFHALRGDWVHLKLPQRINASAILSTKDDHIEPGLPEVEIVDMREELKAGVRSMFSRKLQESLRHVLDSNEQAILFLNRRGSATFIFCYDCGHTIKCPRCGIPLTYHTTADGLLCHHCGYRRNLPKACPNCGSERIRRFGAGTERVESEIKTLLPEARILRWDAETTRGKDAHEIILGHFSAHHADILIGTQMVAKGHDFPLVTLAGILMAETGLNLPDYKAAERTFQLITQVAGRAGRSNLGGNVVLQTYQPDHYAIQNASRHDLAGFYSAEIEQRRRLHYPPFTRLARLLFLDTKEERCRAEAEKLQRAIQGRIEQENFGASSVGGALPCYFARENGVYRYQVILRSPDPAKVLRGLPLGTCRVQIDPVDLL